MHRISWSFEIIIELLKSFVIAHPHVLVKRIHYVFYTSFRIILGCLLRASCAITEILSIPIWAQGEGAYDRAPQGGWGTLWETLRVDFQDGDPNIMGNIKETC